MSAFANLLPVIEAIAKEKGIAPEILIDIVENSLVKATRSSRFVGPQEHIEAKLNRDNGQFIVVSVKEVVEKVFDDTTEITLADAKGYYPDVELGEEIEIPKEIPDLGRIGAQAAKQHIMQAVREHEREIIMSTFGGKVHEIMSGNVTRFDRRRYFVDLGRAEGVLPFNETIPGEEFRRNDRVQVIVQEVQDTPQGPVILLSRTSPEFMRKRFEMEVPEIADGTIQIHTIVRDPGVRAKMSVISRDKNVDPVGACVGVKGSRVQSIVRELRGENIDIIPWTENIAEYVTHALSPAKVRMVKVNYEEEGVEVLVDEDQLSLAIGKRGQNVRLAHRLLGWKIDIYSPTKLKEMGLTMFDEVIDNPFGEEMTVSPSGDRSHNPFREPPRMKPAPELPTVPASKPEAEGDEDGEKEDKLAAFASASDEKAPSRADGDGTFAPLPDEDAETETDKKDSEEA